YAEFYFTDRYWPDFGADESRQAPAAARRAPRAAAVGRPEEIVTSLGQRIVTAIVSLAVSAAAMMSANPWWFVASSASAAGITQVLETKRYTEIIMTRVTVPVGEDIGFSPGTEEEKMSPWMGASEDNLDVSNMGEGEGNGDWGRAATMDSIRSRIKVKSSNFMRGRTFSNKYSIIDEA
ncbi:hypothetical protein OY671_009567, partial [Metschnikowia pulcherrima]